MRRADVQDDLFGANRLGREECPVEHEVGSRRHQRAILGAERFAFRSVDEDHGASIRSLRHGSPLPADREGRPAATEQAAGFERRDHGRVPARRGTQSREMFGERLHPGRDRRPAQQSLHRRFHHVGACHAPPREPPSTTEASWLRFDRSAANRHATATATASTQAAWVGSIQSAQLSVPDPTPCRSVSGHAA